MIPQELIARFQFKCFLSQCKGVVMKTKIITNNKCEIYEERQSRIIDLYQDGLLTRDELQKYYNWESK